MLLATSRGVMYKFANGIVNTNEFVIDGLENYRVIGLKIVNNLIVVITSANGVFYADLPSTSDGLESLDFIEVPNSTGYTYSRINVISNQIYINSIDSDGTGPTFKYIISSGALKLDHEYLDLNAYFILSSGSDYSRAKYYIGKGDGLYETNSNDFSNLEKVKVNGVDDEDIRSEATIDDSDDIIISGQKSGLICGADSNEFIPIDNGLPPIIDAVSYTTDKEIPYVVLGTKDNLYRIQDRFLYDWIIGDESVQHQMADHTVLWIFFKNLLMENELYF